MHHQSLQSDFQPPYFPPPFHHSAQSPPQQQNHGPLEYLSSDPYGQPLSSLHHAPLHHYNQLAGLRPSQDQLGIHRTHREAELQGHVVSLKKINFYFQCLNSVIFESIFLRSKFCNIIHFKRFIKPPLSFRWHICQFMIKSHAVFSITQISNIECTNLY